MGQQDKEPQRHLTPEEQIELLIRIKRAQRNGRLTVIIHPPTGPDLQESPNLPHSTDSNN